MAICPKCFADNPPEAKVCQQCTAVLTAPTCPAGHNMDPTWTECAYCKAEGLSDSKPVSASPVRRETVVESLDTGRTRRSTETESDPYVTPPPDPRLDSPGKPRSKTQFYAPPAKEAVAGRVPTVAENAKTTAPGRKIVGILITYTWRSDGQIFPVREGRNLIGRDADKCEIVVPEDDTLSGVNTHITFRKSFTIGDNVSMSGTDLNGEPVEEQFRPLNNYATIRTGSTHWTFIAINPGQPAGSEAGKT